MRAARDSALAWATRHRRTIALVAITLAPLVATAIVVVTRADLLAYRTGDHALIELGTRDVTDHPVLLGVYSRFGWHHPGPLLLYVYAVPFHLLGQRPEALSLAAVLLAVGSVTGIAWIAHRRGGARLLLWTLLVIAAYLRVAEVTTTSIWNPFVTMLPFALVGFLAWTLACRDWWALPILVAVGSLVVQGHAGYVAPVAACVAFGVGVAAFEADRDRRHDRDWDATRSTITRVALVALGVAFLAWLPPLIQQVTDDPGNLNEIATFARDRGQQHSLGTAIDKTASYLGSMAVLVSGSVPNLSGRERGLSDWATVLSLGTFTWAAFVGWRTRNRDLVKLCALVALLVLVSVFTVTRIAGQLDQYLVRWITTIGIALWVALGAAVLTLVDERGDAVPAKWRRYAAGAVVAALVLVSASETVNALRKSPRAQAESDDVPEVVAQAEDALAAEPETDAVVIRIDDGRTWRQASALMLQLERKGYTVKMDRDSEFRVRIFLPDWRLTRADPDDVVLVVDREDGEVVVNPEGIDETER